VKTAIIAFFADNANGPLTLMGFMTFRNKALPLLSFCPFALHSNSAKTNGTALKSMETHANLV